MKCSGNFNDGGIKSYYKSSMSCDIDNPGTDDATLHVLKQTSLTTDLESSISLKERNE